MTVSKSKIIFGVGVTLALMFLCGVFLIYFQLRDVEFIRGVVIGELQEMTGRKVELGSADLDFTEGVSLRLNQVRLKDRKSDSTEWSADKVWVTVRPVPLLRRDIQIRRVTLEGLSLQVTRLEDGQIQVGNPQNDSSAENPTSDSSGIPLWVQAGLAQDFTLREGQIRFVDRKINPNGEPVEMVLDDLSMTVSKPLLKMLLSFEMEGEVRQVSGKPAPLKFSGTLNLTDINPTASNVWSGALSLDHLRADPFRPYLNAWLPLYPENQWVSLTLDLNQNAQGFLEGSGQLIHKELREEKSATLRAQGGFNQGKLVYAGQWTGNGININQFEYQSGEAKISLEGSLDHWHSDHPKLSFSLNTSELDVTQATRILPFKSLSKRVHAQFRRYLEKGRVEIRRMKFDGLVEQFLHINQPVNQKMLTLELGLRGVDFGPELPPLKKVMGVFEMEKGAVQWKIPQAHWDQLRLSAIRGDLNSLAEDAMIDMSLHAQGDLLHLRQIWNREFPQQNFSSGSFDAFDPKGKFSAEVSMAGRAINQEDWALEGKATLDQISFKQNWVPEQVKSLKGEMYFVSRPKELRGKGEGSLRTLDLEFKSVSGKLGEHAFTNVGGQWQMNTEGTRQNWHGDLVLAEMDAGKLTERISSGTAAPLLSRLKLESGDISFNYQSDTHPLKKTDRFRGTLNIKNISLKHKDRFRILHGLTGILLFDQKRIALETQQAFYGDSPIKIKGELQDYSGSRPKLDLKVKSTDFMSGDFQDIPFLRTINYKGPSEVQTDIKSTGGELKIVSQVDLSRASYRWQKFLVKPAEVSNHLAISAHLSQNSDLKFDRLVFELAGTRIVGKGTIRDENKPEFAVRLAARDFDPRSISNYVRLLKGSRDGKVDFELEGKGLFQDTNSYEYKGRIRLKDVVYETPKFPRPIRVNAESKFINNRVKIRQGHLVSGRTDLQFRGDLLYGDNPVLNLSLGGKSLVLSDWITGEDENQPSLLEVLGQAMPVRRGSGKVRLDVRRFRHKFWNLENISADLTLKDHIFTTKNMEIGLKGKNHVMLQGRMNLSAPSKPVLEALVIARKISAAGFMNIFGDLYKGSLSGKLNWLKAKVTTTGKDWNEFRSNLNGTLSLDLANGRIHTGKLLNGAVAMFGYESDEQEKAKRAREKDDVYQAIHGNFKLVNSVAHTEDFIYGTKDRQMSLVGDFNLQNNTMDIVVGVAPLKQLDEFLTQIPVVGEIITAGDEQSLIKNYYTVKGPFNDPELTSVPLTSLEKKVVGTLQGIFQASPLAPSKEKK